MRSLLSFPNPVNEVAARTVAAGVLVLCSLVAFAGWTWLLVPIAYGFIARVASGPRFSPLGLLVTKVIVGRLPFRPRYVAGPPKRFAQGMGAVMATTAAVLAFGFGLDGEARVVAALIVVAATLEAVFGICIGCRVFAALMRRGLVPESVCLDCARIDARSAA
jgi:hypothetical protein